MRGIAIGNRVETLIGNAGPRCQRCKQPDRAGLANVRGLMLCRICHLIALARHHQQ